MAYSKQNKSRRRSTGRFIFDELSGFGGMALREAADFGDTALHEICGYRQPKRKQQRRQSKAKRK